VRPAFLCEKRHATDIFAGRSLPVCEVLKSRMRPPGTLLEVVPRDDLLGLLDADRSPLVVFFAPGGFGKTIALTQWAARDPRPFSWLQTDAADNDPLLFLTSLVAALGSAVTVDANVSAWLDLAPPPVSTRILPALAASLSAAPPFVVVLDDVHLLTNEACWQIVGVVLDNLSPGAQLCVSGRTRPPLPVARLRAAGRLLEVGSKELALSLDEAGRLLGLHNVAADGETVAYLQGVTEGWAAGLSLATLAGKGQTTADWLGGIRGHQSDIAGYLTSEVLERQPADVARFLLQTSILERMSASLCRAVTGTEDAGRLLHRVARDGLFVSSLDDEGTWFRYHHLFAEFLQAELLDRSEAETAGLHRRAAAWFEKHGRLEEAVRHWLAAGEDARAGTIVCRAFMEYTRSARHETIRRWLDMFTEEQILADDALTLTAGWIAASKASDSPAGRKWIAAAAREHMDDTLWPGGTVSLRAMQAALRACLGFEGVARMRSDAELAVSLMGRAELVERAAAETVLGAAYWLSGDVEAARRTLQTAEEDGAVANVLAQIGAAGHHALLLMDEGRWAEAKLRMTTALERFEECGLTWASPVILTLVAQASILAHDEDPAATQKVANIDQILSLSRVLPWTALTAEVLVAESLVRQGELSEATRWMHAGLARLKSWPDAGILGPRLRRLQDVLEQRRLLKHLTPAECRVFALLPTQLTVAEIAARLFLSIHTVKTHMRHAYAKLEVTTRTDAVDRGRQVGLLAPAEVH
jgi:LuxR family maltose regulon positive regulatory protein